jgi:ATP synthase protein I
MAPVGAVMDKDDRGNWFTRSVGAMQESATQAGSAAAASYTLIGAVVVLGAAGYALDRWLGTSPWGVLAGLLLGIAVGFYELVKSTWKRR